MKHVLFVLLLVTVACQSKPPENPPVQNDGPVPVAAAVPAGHKVTFKNQCKETVWLGSVGNSGFSGLEGGGWEMVHGSTREIIVPVKWSGRFWPRTECVFAASGNCPTKGVPCCASGSCLTSDNTNFGLKCGFSGVPPTSLVEVTMDAPSGNGPYDTYDMSFVDGWSVPAKIEPVAGTYNPTRDPGITAPWCKVSGCTGTPVCPAGFAVAGSPNSCWSPCQVAVRSGSADASKLCCSCNLKTACTCPAACCAGQYGCSPYSVPANPADMTCDPWNTDKARAWDATSISFITAVKAVCPQVYSWQFDDHAATFNCRKTSGIVDYTVTLCP